MSGTLTLEHHETCAQCAATDLRALIEHALDDLSRGLTRAQIIDLLRSAGCYGVPADIRRCPIALWIQDYVPGTWIGPQGDGEWYVHACSGDSQLYVSVKLNSTLSALADAFDCGDVPELVRAKR